MDAFVRLSRNSYRRTKHMFQVLSRTDPLATQQFIYTASIGFEPDEDYSQVWEFISYLNIGKRDEPVVGKKWAQWYSWNQRHEYLLRQLDFEKISGSIKFLTPTLTNAIATDEHLRIKCRPKYKENETEVMTRMFDRRNKLQLKDTDI